ncbi:hypothetical protein ACHAWX_000064, partial [Stephanocyclus meneghinianus]
MRIQIPTLSSIATISGITSTFADNDAPILLLKKVKVEEKLPITVTEIIEETASGSKTALAQQTNGVKDKLSLHMTANYDTDMTNETLPENERVDLGMLDERFGVGVLDERSLQTCTKCT